MSEGNLYIISGPSGSGKDTVLAEVFKIIPNLKFSISSITRPMRSGEVEGEKYNFISREQFEYMIENNMLLEHNQFLGNYYGTPKQPVIDSMKAGNDIIIEVDVNGAAQIRKNMPEAISIFIMPPSLEVLEHRLRKRGTEDEEKIQKRLSEAKGEMDRSCEYSYVVVNDALEDAVKEVVEIIKSNK